MLVVSRRPPETPGHATSRSEGVQNAKSQNAEVAESALPSCPVFVSFFDF